MCFKSSFPIAPDIKEDRWYPGTSPHFFLVLSFALHKLCLLCWNCTHPGAGGVRLVCVGMAPCMRRLHFITAGPEIKIRQKVRWISYGTSLALLKAGCRTGLASPWEKSLKTLHANLISQNDAFPDKECCNQLLPKEKKPNFFSYRLICPLISLLLFNSSSAFSVWPFFYCAEHLHGAGSCYSESLRGSRRLKVSL